MTLSSDYKLPILRNFIGNEWVDATPRAKRLVDPSEGNSLGTQVSTSTDALDAALRYADICHQSRSWFGLGAKRADLLLRIASKLEPELADLAFLESVNTGVVISQTRPLLSLLPAMFRGAAAQIAAHPDWRVIDDKHQVEHWHKPWGPALCLAPWNSPAPIGMHKLASALAAGAPVILKPSEFTPFTTQRIFEVIAECGLPLGAAQLVHGSGLEGAYLAADARIRAVSFTGGLGGGMQVAQICARTLKPLQLELGGHNPFIVLPGADLHKVVDGIIAGMTTLNGQWCRAIGRIILPDNMRDQVVAEVLARADRLIVGCSTDSLATMGPLIHAEHKRHLVNTVRRLEQLGGVRLVPSKQFPQDSNFMLPELIEGLSPEDDQTELFGPVASLHSYQVSGNEQKDLRELKDLVNHSPFGLAAYVYGSDQSTMYELARDLNVGSTKINGVTITSLAPSAPRSAWGVSGHGEEGSFETFRFFQGSTVIGTV